MLQKTDYKDLCKRIVDQLIALTNNPELPIGDLFEQFDLLMKSTEEVLDKCKNEQVYFTDKFHKLAKRSIEINNAKKKLKLLIIEVESLMASNQSLLQQDSERYVKIQMRIAQQKAAIARYEEEAKWKWYYTFFPVIGLIILGIRAKISEGQKVVEILENQIDSATLVRTQAQIIADKDKITSLKVDALKYKKADEDLKIQLDKAEAEKITYATKTSSAQSMKAQINALKLYIDSLKNNTEYEVTLNILLETIFDFESMDGSIEKIPVKEALLKWGDLLNQRLNANGKNILAVHLEINKDALGNEINPVDIGHLYKMREREWALGAHDEIPSSLADVYSLFKGPFFEYQHDEWSIYAENADHTLHLTINIFAQTATLTVKSSGEKIIAKITDASTTAEIKVHRENSLSKEQMEQICLERNWRPATAFEVTTAWINKDLNEWMYGRILDGRFAVPVQSDTPNFKKGVNIVDGGGGQGFFYIDNNDAAF